MTLKKGFLNSKPDYLFTSKTRLITGLILGLCYSFILYSFLYMSREAFRISSATEYYDLWILSEKEVNFYNLIFALVSVIFGQSISFLFWFDRPRRIYQKNSFLKLLIINDQVFLNWNFFAWFAQLAALYGMWFGMTLQGGFYTFSLYPKYNYIFVIIVLALFLQTWTSLRRALTNRGLKLMLLTASTLFIIALGFSRINLIDYKEINNQYNQNNLYKKYEIDLPEANYTEKLFKKSLILDMHLVISEGRNETQNPLIIIRNKVVNIDNLSHTLNDWLSRVKEWDIPKVTVRLHIHKKIKMDYINEIRKRIAGHNIRRIAYAVIPKNIEFDKRFYNDFSFSEKIPVTFFKDSLLRRNIQTLDTFSNNIVINQNVTNFNLNDSTYVLDDLQKEIQKLILKDNNYLVKYIYNEQQEFSNYFSFIDGFRMAIIELRNNYSERKFSMPYEALTEKQSKEVRRAIPSRRTEIVNE